MKKITIFVSMMILVAVSAFAEYGTGKAANVPKKILEAFYVADYAYNEVLKDFKSKNIEIEDEYMGDGYLIKVNREEKREAVTIINGDLAYFFHTGESEVIEGFHIRVESVRICDLEGAVLYYRVSYRENSEVFHVYYVDNEKDLKYFEEY